MLDKGRIVEVGRHDALMAKHGVDATLVARQSAAAALEAEAPVGAEPEVVGRSVYCAL